MSGIAIISGLGRAPLWIDSINGSDANSGHSRANAKASFAGLAAAFNLTGRRIIIADNSVLREILTVPDGATILRTGDGATRPIISGADLLANANFSLAAGKTYTYQYSLPSIPSTYNPDANVTNSKVLQVWENNARVGPSIGGQTSIAGVEANAGSWWWDNTNKILYIHPSDGGNPITNGKTYEVSVRTNAIRGGDGFYVDGLIGEKAGAQTTAGQQGYAILGYKSGYYKNCVGRYGWNHCAGVANTLDANPLTFDTCEFFDHERQSAAVSSTCFVAYKSGTPGVASHVRVKDCWSHMTALNPSYTDTGFYAHGLTTAVEWLGTNFASNFFYGRQLTSDTSQTAFSHTVSDVLVATGGEYGQYVDVTGLSSNVVGANDLAAVVQLKQVSGAVVHTATIRGINCRAGGVCYASADGGAILTIANSKIMRTSTPSTPADGSGVSQSNVHGQLKLINSYVYNNYAAYQGAYPTTPPILATTDNNVFSGCLNIYSGISAYSPDHSASLSTWRSVSGLDANSAVSSWTPSADDLTLPVWSGTPA